MLWLAGRAQAIIAPGLASGLGMFEVAALSAPRPVTVEALIVSYQTRELLLQTITTLLAHPPPPDVAELSVAVFDNASSDASADMVAADFRAARLVRSPANIGFGAANNELARTSGADYLLLLNSDVIVTEDLIAPLLTALRADPAAAVAGPRLMFPDGRPQHSSQRFPTLKLELALVLKGTRASRLLPPVFDPERVVAASREHELQHSREPRHTDFLWATCWLLERREVSEHGLFDERFTTYDEDLDFCRRLAERGRRALFVPGVCLIHLGGASSTTAAKEAMMRRGRRRYFAHHRGRLSEQLYARGVGAVVGLKRLRAR